LEGNRLFGKLFVLIGLAKCCAYQNASYSDFDTKAIIFFGETWVMRPKRSFVALCFLALYMDIGGELQSIACSIPKDQETAARAVAASGVLR